MAEAAARFASFNWNELLSAAVELAEAGLRVDWYSSLKIASAARDIDRFATTRSIYLPGGFVPVGEWSGPAPSNTVEWPCQHPTPPSHRRA